ncbi:MAG: hypothetical protein P0121_17160 [Nitrospira sp.]|nr:hypothetical protein [Nitrospira sp.]
MMTYAGIDLHATNSVVVVLNDADRVLYQKRLRNDLPLIRTALEPYRTTVQGVAVESTYNPGFRSKRYRPKTTFKNTLIVNALGCQF